MVDTGDLLSLRSDIREFRKLLEDLENAPDNGSAHTIVQWIVERVPLFADDVEQLLDSLVKDSP